MLPRQRQHQQEAEAAERRQEQEEAEWKQPDLKRHGAACRLQRVWRAYERQRSSRYTSTVLQSAVRIWLAKKQVEGRRQRLQRQRDDLQRHGAASFLQRVWRACERNKAKPIVLESDEQEIETGECVARALCRLALWV